MKRPILVFLILLIKHTLKALIGFHPHVT